MPDLSLDHAAPKPTADDAAIFIERLERELDLPRRSAGPSLEAEDDIPAVSPITAIAAGAASLGLALLMLNHLPGY